MGSFWLLKLPEFLQGAGCKVTTFKGWETRSRSTGGLDAILGVVAHHTAGGTNEASGEAYSYQNAADKPIGNLHLRRDGTYVIGAAGAANTQGKGGAVTTSKGTVPLNQGNKYMIAIEAHNNGIGEVWPKAQIDAYLRGLWAICNGYGLDPSRDIFTHYGYCEPSCKGRKIDPAGPTPSQPTLGGTSGRSTWPQAELRRLVVVTGGGKPPAPDPSPPKPPDPKPTVGKYTVVSGDSWWSISQKYKITVDQLLKLNPPATSSTVIHPGDVLNVPGGSTPTPTPPTPTPPTPTPPPTGNWAADLMSAMPILSKGASGIYVKRLQHFLALSGQMDPTNMANFDGKFGSGTETALNRFKATKGAKQDGVCDRSCWDWFMEAGNGIPTIKKGATGMDVKRMQRMLAANGYMDPANQANFDGQWGSGTESAKTKFDNARGLTPSPPTDCGQKSWTKLLNG